MATSGKHSWIEDSDVFSLFPTLVWKTQLRAGVHEAIAASALELLRSLRQGLPELKTGEAWQSGHALHAREELRELCDCVRRTADAVAELAQLLARVQGMARLPGFAGLQLGQALPQRAQQLECACGYRFVHPGPKLGFPYQGGEQRKDVRILDPRLLARYRHGAPASGPGLLRLDPRALQHRSPARDLGGDERAELLG